MMSNNHNHRPFCITEWSVFYCKICYNINHTQTCNSNYGEGVTT